MLTLVLAAALSVNSLQPLRELVFPTYYVHQTLHVSYAFDERYEYLGTPDGLFRTENLLDPAQPLEQIALAGRPVSAIATANGMLYVQTGEMDWADVPTVYRSRDHGADLQPMADGLRVCADERCPFLTGRQIAVDGDRVFIEAGGNLFVSGDESQPWRQLAGLIDESMTFPALSVCRPASFAVSGRRVFYGGAECVNLLAGMLTPDRDAWSNEEPVRRALEDRNVLMIQVAGEHTVYAGTDAGLWRSDDDGASYREILGWGIREHYFGAPPVDTLVISTRYPGLMIAGGLNSLEVSADGGQSWAYASPMLYSDVANDPVSRYYAHSLALVAQNRDGDLFAAVRVRDHFFIVRLVVAPQRHRAAR